MEKRYVESPRELRSQFTAARSGSHYLLISPCSAQWNVQRKATSKIFSAANFRGCITTCIDADIAKLRTIVGNHADAGEAFDLSVRSPAPVVPRKTDNAVSRLSSSPSLSLRSLRWLSESTLAPSRSTTAPPSPLVRLYFPSRISSSLTPSIAVAFDYAQSRIDARIFEPTWPITELFSAEGRKMRNATKTISDFAYGIIDQRAKDLESGYTSEKGAGSTDLLTLYMALRDEKGEPMSRKALRDAYVQFFLLLAKAR